MLALSQALIGDDSVISATLYLYCKCITEE
ncbi:Uncharacterised protein [Citrobacter amalonaticus]|nr:Uncharacterised protein [Citrobacter amalonaticus]